MLVGSGRHPALPTADGPSAVPPRALVVVGDACQPPAVTPVIAAFKINPPGPRTPLESKSDRSQRASRPPTAKEHHRSGSERSVFMLGPISSAVNRIWQDRLESGRQKREAIPNVLWVGRKHDYLLLPQTQKRLVSKCSLDTAIVKVIPNVVNTRLRHLVIAWILKSVVARGRKYPR